MNRSLGSSLRHHTSSVFVIAAAIVAIVAAPAIAVEASSATAASGPRPFSPRSGPPHGVPGGRSVTWSQPPDLNGVKISSERYVSPYESEVADDFMLPDRGALAFNFWGGYWDWSAGDPVVPAFYIRIYDDAGCTPGALIAEEFAPVFTTTFEGFDGWGWPTYRYHISQTWLDLPPNERLWIVFQADHHTIPPYWGRQQAIDQRDCQAMFRSDYYGYPAWTPVSDVVGYPFDTAFEVDCQGCAAPRGACCLDDGRCILSYGSACNGQFMGDWTSCEPNPCPAPPLGACCGAAGSCVQTIESECLSGDWRSGASCAPDPCPDTPKIGDCLKYQDFPHWVGSVALPGDPKDVALSAELALVAEGEDGVQVIDIRRPDAPRVLGVVDTPGWALGVAISGTTGYVADSTGFRVIDLAGSPPSIIGSLDMGIGHSVAVSGTHAYVVGGPYFAVIDVSDPRNPTLAGYESSSYEAPFVDVAVAGGFAYVAGQRDLAVLDVADPGAPTFVGFASTPSPARGLALQGSFVYLADQASGLQVVDASDPQHPHIVGSAATELPAMNVAVTGGIAHVTVQAGDTAALEMFDLADPAAPRAVNGTDIPGRHAWGIAASGSLLGYTYANHYWSGGSIYFMDVTSARGVPLLGKLDLAGNSFHELSIRGDVGYALTDPWGLGARGFQVLDLSHAPSSITVLGSLDQRGGNMDVSEPFAYISDVSEGMEQMYIRVIDVSDPRSPRTRGNVGIGGQQSSPLAVSGSYIYTANTSGLIVVDVHDPDAPAIVATLDSPMEWVAGVEISGSYVYLAGPQFLDIVDVSSPVQPVLAARIDFTTHASGLTVAGGFAYLHQYGPHEPDGVQIIDVADPHNPTLRGRFTTPAANGSMVVSGPLLYMAAGGLLVADVADPDRPAVVGGAIQYPLSSVEVADTLVYVSSNDLLVMSVECSPTAGTSESTVALPILDLRAHPNPAQGSTTLRCTVPTRGRARASIFELSGRHVRTLFQGSWEAGVHDLVWDGQDARGRPVAAGIYFARLTTDSANRSTRIVIVR